MNAGLAGALLVFTGFWHATEFLMDGRRSDTLRLVPVGLLYILLGWWIVTSFGGSVVQIIALLLTGAGGAIAFLKRDEFEVRKWVTWAFILIDAIIVLALIVTLLG